MALAKIVYASMGGNNKQVADIIADELKNKGIDVEEDEMEDYDPEDLTEADIAIAVSYTYSLEEDGQLPDEALDFYDDLQDTDLTGKIYGAAGSGDKTYGDYFCTAVDKFDKRLAETGATKGAEDVKIDLEPDDNDKANLVKFADDLVKKVNG